MAGKLPRFFCEFCGTEVKRNDRICPSCGKFFTAVRCPSCGLTGKAALFIRGCPSCGYAVLPGTVSANSPDAKKKQKRARKPRLGGWRLHRGTAGRRAQGAGGDPLPLWVYIAVAALFALVVVGVAVSW